MSHVEIVGIGCSTGGPSALMHILPKFSQLIEAPILITQHSSGTFTESLAEQLARASGRNCHVARTADILEPHHIYLAPSDSHLTVRHVIGENRCFLDHGPAENYCKPSVDPMLRSMAKVFGRRALAIILTGMGKDGLEGCRAIVAEGGRVIAQDKHTSAVWGMPGAVVEAGLADAKVPLPLIPETVHRFYRTRSSHP